MAKIEIRMEGYRCERCNHEWVPRSNEKPVICPACKTPYWNRARKNNKRK